MKYVVLSIFFWIFAYAPAYSIPLYYVDDGIKETSDCICYDEKYFIKSVVSKYHEKLIFEGERKVFNGYLNTIRLYMNQKTKTWSLVQYFEYDNKKTICIIEVGVNGKNYE